MAYDYQIGIIRAKEYNLLKRNDWDRILSIPSLRDVWAELVRLDLGYEEVGELELLKSISLFYSKNIKNLYSDICGYFLDENLKKSFLYEMDIYNLKLIYKQKKFGKNFDDKFIDSGYYPVDDLLKYVVDEIWLNFKEPFFEDIFLILKSENLSMTPYDFDVFVDSKLFEYRLSFEQSDFIKQFWKMKIDFYNLKLFVYKNDVFITNGNIDVDDWKEGNEEVLTSRLGIAKFAFSGSALDWEKEEERAILDFVDDSIMYFETSEPIVAYFYKRYIEIKNINRLVYGRAFKLTNSKIEEQLVFYS